MLVARRASVCLYVRTSLPRSREGQPHARGAVCYVPVLVLLRQVVYGVWNVWVVCFSGCVLEYLPPYYRIVNFFFLCFRLLAAHNANILITPGCSRFSFGTQQCHHSFPVLCVVLPWVFLLFLLRCAGAEVGVGRVLLWAVRINICTAIKSTQRSPCRRLGGMLSDG